MEIITVRVTAIGIGKVTEKRQRYEKQQKWRKRPLVTAGQPFHFWPTQLPVQPDVPNAEVNQVSENY
jgi:hypothetical protein